MIFAIVITVLTLAVGLGLFIVERLRVRRRRMLHERATAYHQRQKDDWEQASKRGSGM